MSTGSDEYFYNLKTVRSDPRLAYVLMREARCRTIERTLGVPRDQQYLLTLILLGMAWRAAAARSQRALDRVPGRPSRNGLLIGSSMLDEAVHLLAGDSTPDAPLVGSMVALALLAAFVRPGVHDIRAAARTARAELARIPQYIVRLNRPDDAPSSS
jgi:hypothetical protein